MTGEDALKTLATAAGMRAVVTQLALVYTGQQEKKKPDGKSPKRTNHDRKRWPPAGGTPPSRPNQGTERGPIVPEKGSSDPR
jgi:hypothetical protein